MRLAYFDCFSGLSGDMALAALIHAGADLDAILPVLRAFPVDDFAVEVEEVDVRGIAAVHLRVESGPQGVIRTYSSIRSLLDQVDMPALARRTAQRIYRRLSEAVAVAHGKDVELVTFHEFGPIDCLVDVVGCSLALDQLGVERVFASPVPTGLGMARTEHGMAPVPSAVVMELLRGVPTYSRGIPVELVTAPGAAILAAVSEGYGDMPMMRSDRVGYGSGALRLDFPNLVRVVIGEEQRAGRAAGTAGDRPTVSLADLMADADVLVHAVVDSLTRAQQGRALERLHHAGATEAWAGDAYGPGRAGRTVLWAIAPPEARDEVVQAMRESAGTAAVTMSPVIAARTTP